MYDTAGARLLDGMPGPERRYSPEERAGSGAAGRERIAEHGRRFHETSACRCGAVPPVLSSERIDARGRIREAVRNRPRLVDERVSNERPGIASSARAQLSLDEVRVSTALKICWKLLESGRQEPDTSEFDSPWEHPLHTLRTVMAFLAGASKCDWSQVVCR